MKNLKSTALILLGLKVFSSCEETDVTEFSEGLQVKVGKQCGWCFGYEQLTITAEVSSYYYDYACDDSLDVAEQFFKTPAQDWETINEYLDKNLFQSLDLNTCSVCADGCDYTITVIDTNFEHEIRFDNLDKIADETSKAFAQSITEQLDKLNTQN